MENYNDVVYPISERLIDYVIFVGHKYEKKHNEKQHETDYNGKIKPQILRRFPTNNHSDFALPDDVVYFCLPDGIKEYGANDFSHHEQESNTFIFTLTNKDTSIVRYGVCTQFYRSVSDVYSLITMCMVSHHNMFKNFRKCLLVLKQLMNVVKNDDQVIALGECPWSLFLHDTKKNSDIYPKILMDIELWIINLLNTHSPIPNVSKIQMDLLPQSIGNTLVFASPDITRFELIDFPFHIPFELIGVEKCITILKLILFEQKIIFKSRDYNTLTMTITAFINMLSPMKYMFPLIPLLPASMPQSEQIFLAPTPYVIGVSKCFFDQDKKLKIPNDVWMIDIDSSEILRPRYKYVLPAIPEPEYTILRVHLHQTLDSISHDNDINRPTAWHDISYSKKHVLKQKNIIFGNDMDSTDVATRVILAAEYLSEWLINPSNLSYFRVCNGIYDPISIGDKPRWYNSTLRGVKYKLFDNLNTLSKLMDYNNTNGQNYQHPDIHIGDITCQVYLEDKFLNIPANFNNDDSSKYNVDTVPSSEDEKSDNNEHGEISKDENNTDDANVTKKEDITNQELMKPKKSKVYNNLIKDSIILFKNASNSSKRKFSHFFDLKLEKTDSHNRMVTIIDDILIGKKIGWLTSTYIKRLIGNEKVCGEFIFLLHNKMISHASHQSTFNVEVSYDIAESLLLVLKNTLKISNERFMEKNLNNYYTVYLVLEILRIAYVNENYNRKKSSESIDLQKFKNIYNKKITMVYDKIVCYERSNLRNTLVGSNDSSIINHEELVSNDDEINILKSKNNSFSTNNDYNEKLIPSIITDRNSIYSTNTDVTNVGSISSNGPFQDKPIFNSIKGICLNELIHDKYVLWNNSDIWENILFDVISYERDHYYMEYDNPYLLNLYRNSDSTTKKKMEWCEDYLLSSVIHNIFVFMLMVDIKKTFIIKSKFLGIFFT
ncbi:Connecdenn 2 [Intoshia linei]|uniref:Connecdenn 2 n=1 Tax=Intoshia linei TaxID=1819745 RepID=A0A177BDR1_9BILA|nr:Connecdenn 2 [Intoshia linei]